MPEIKYLQFGISFVAVSNQGLIPLVSTKLPFIDDDKIETFLMRYTTPIGMMIGQGDQFFTGLYGPFPVTNNNDWIAYTYSFFMLDFDIGTPRDETNIYTIGVLFLPKQMKIPAEILEELFDSFVKEIKNVKSLKDKTIFNEFIKNISMNFKLKSPKIFEKSPQQTPKKEEKKEFFQELPTIESGEALIAVPWILHSVYHGLERASSDVLGGKTNLLEQLAEQYTAEILDRFHLLEKLDIKKDENAVKRAIDLGIEHLEKVGEKVKINPVSDNKFELDIECAFADSVHPYVPIDKCLWIKYLAAIISKVLPPDRDLEIYNSDFDEKGSVTYLEIKKKPFVTIK
ncbi:MAG: hypothetical protein ACW981_14710 [Candidatus Hodarchaeales archaeon]|jgi:hypothetical protein